MQSNSHHHLHTRKRIHQRHQTYPHPKANIRLIDKLIYVISILGPAMTIPQVLKIWSEKSSDGVSLISWISYAIVAIIWIIYGIAHKEKPIILANSIFLALGSMVVLGVLVYS